MIKSNKLLSMLMLAGVAQAELFAVKAGHLLDIETGHWQSNKVVLIDGEKISAIIDSAPKNVRVIDWSARWVLPGLMDAHVHLSAEPYRPAYDTLGVSIPAASITAVASARTMLRAGFTTVRSAGDYAYIDVALRDAVAKGEAQGPDILAAGMFIGITGGHCDNNLLAPEFGYKDVGVADGPWAVRAKVREAVKHGANVIKFCASGGVLSKGDAPGTQEYTFEEMQALVEEAHKLGRKVLAHSHGIESTKTAIRAGVDSIEHASLIDSEGIALAKAHGTYLVFDIYNDEFIREEGAKAGMLPESLEKEKLVAQAQRNNFSAAVKAGAPLAYGTDAGVYPHKDVAKQFAWMVRYGMTPLQALQSATLHTAKLFGKESVAGKVAVGYRADMIAVDSDPLKDIAVLEKLPRVIARGVEVK